MSSSARKWGEPVPSTVRHGTLYCYRVYRCECDVCEAAKVERATARLGKYEAQKDGKWGTPVPAGRKHGGNTWARRIYGCECRVCLPTGRSAPGRPPGAEKPLSQLERGKRLRLAKRGTPVPPTVQHGTVYAYRTYGCLCEVCRATVRQRRLVKENAWRDRARGHWHDDEERGITVVHWPPASLEETWQCPVCDFKKEVPA